MQKEEQNLENSCKELKRHLSRLSFVGMGLSKELDSSLAKLRLAVKKDEPESNLKIIIDDISKDLRSLEDEPKSKQQQKVIQEVNLIELLLKQKLPIRLKTNLEKANKKSQHSDANSIMTAIAKEIKTYVENIESSAAIQDSQRVTNNESKNAKQGFLTSLFTKKNSNEEKTQSSSIADSESAANLEKELSNVDGNLLQTTLPPDIKNSLQRLVEQLASMDGYQDIAEVLTAEISKIKTISQLSSILELIASAFIEISDQEHMQFESFLKSLNQRIIRVNDFIGKTLNFSQSNEQDNEQLNIDLSQNISSIKKSLTNSKTLAEAEQSIAKNMDSMLSQINEFCETQQNKSDILISQVEKLKEQMIATEDEATRLKDDLAEQRVRAQTDQLTNLPNRYAYNERLTQEYNRWRRYRNSLTLVVCDIDSFKKVNDTHGHSFGDLVLKKIAACLHAGIRESDFVARFGGEEFVILLPETTLIDATRAMNKMRQSINQIELINKGVNVEISMSFGISEFTNDDTTKAVFERADSALYRAKDKGRNRVCCQRAPSIKKEN
ncbi:MAG: GGDEF domain-containing protein [Kangiellaceae bacterium]